MNFMKSFISSGGTRDPSSRPLTEEPERIDDSIEDYLPQAVEDKTIIDLFRDVQGMLEEHVDNFYQPSASPLVQSPTAEHAPGQYHAPSPGLSSRASAQVGSYFTSQVGANNKVIDTTNMTTILSDNARLLSQRNIQATIAGKLFLAIQPFADDPQAGALLPKEYMHLLKLVPDPAEVRDNRVYLRLLGEWRNLTWSLLNQKSRREKNTMLFERRLEEPISIITNEVEKELEPFAIRAEDDQRRKHFRQLLRSVAELGKTLSSQVAQFDFDWESELEDERESDTPTPGPLRRESSDFKKRNGRRRHRKRASDIRSKKMVFFPALVKHSDHGGNKYSRAQKLCESRRLSSIVRQVKRSGTDISLREERQRSSAPAS